MSVVYLISFKITKVCAVDVLAWRLNLGVLRRPFELVRSECQSTFLGPAENGE